MTAVRPTYFYTQAENLQKKIVEQTTKYGAATAAPVKGSILTHLGNFLMTYGIIFKNCSRELIENRTCEIDTFLLLNRIRVLFPEMGDQEVFEIEKPNSSLYEVAELFRKGKATDALALFDSSACEKLRDSVLHAFCDSLQCKEQDETARLEQGRKGLENPSIDLQLKLGALVAVASSCDHIPTASYLGAIFYRAMKLIAGEESTHASLAGRTSPLSAEPSASKPVTPTTKAAEPPSRAKAIVTLEKLLALSKLKADEQLAKFDGLLRELPANFQAHIFKQISKAVKLEVDAITLSLYRAHLPAVINPILEQYERLTTSSD